MSGFRNPDGSTYGRALILSSPNGQKGNFYFQHEESFKKGKDSGSIAFTCATYEINKHVSPAFLRAEYFKDPQGFRQEYGASFLESGDSWLQDHMRYYQNVNTSAPIHLTHGELGKEYFLGSDFALSNDGTSHAVSHYEPMMKNDVEFLCDNFYLNWNGTTEELQTMFNEKTQGLYIVDYTEVRYAGLPPYEDDKVLSIEKVIDWTHSLFGRYPIRYGIFDQWSGEIIRQLTEAKGIKNFEMVTHTEKVNSSQAMLFSELIHSGKLRLPDDPTLHKELLNLQVERRAKGSIKVEAPPGPKNHDDRFDSLIRSLFLAHAYKNKVLSLGGHSLQGMFHGRSTGNPSPTYSNTGSNSFRESQKKRFLKSNTGRTTQGYVHRGGSF